MSFPIIEITLFIMFMCLLALVIYKEYLLYNDNEDDNEEL